MTARSLRLLLTGATGQLGSYLLHALRDDNRPVVAWSLRPNQTLSGRPCHPVDLRDVDQVVDAFQAARPDLVIHAAALSGVGDCYRDAARARQTNVAATALLAELATRHGARLLYVSTDLVFDGNRQWYRETDCPHPLSVYGQTKVSAERVVLRHAVHLVLRISLLYGQTINGRPSFFQQQIDALQAGAPCDLFDDEWRTPLDLPTAARAVLAAATSDVTGLLHVAGPERLTRLEMGRRLADVLGAREATIHSVNREDIPAAEPRPRDTSLCCELWEQLFPQIPRPGYEEALQTMGLGG